MKDLAIEEGAVNGVESSELDETDHQEEIRARVLRYQVFANFSSHVLALVAMSLVITWVVRFGGLSWDYGDFLATFNWHPLMMVTGFCFMTVASLAFRHTFPSRPIRKAVHVMSLSVAIICAIIAMVGAFKSKKIGSYGYFGNLYSLHSWIGTAVIILYLFQYFFGVYAFVSPFASPQTKAKVILIHKFMGPFLYNAVALTMIVGIQEKENFAPTPCYQLTPHYTFFYKNTTTCRVSHALGLVIFFMSLSTSFALYDLGGKKTATRESSGEH